MDNPFETGHIKNYILAYTSVVVIMVLFFIASTLFNEQKEISKKKFAVQKKDMLYTKKSIQKSTDKNTTKFKLMQKSY